MADKQPDYKKSKNDPYDLNTTIPPKERPRLGPSPSPYDLDEGSKIRPRKDVDDVSK